MPPGAAPPGDGGIVARTVNGTVAAIARDTTVAANAGHGNVAGETVAGELDVLPAAAIHPSALGDTAGSPSAAQGAAGASITAASALVYVFPEPY